MKTNPATWLDSYGDTLFRYALLKTGNTMVAEDLVQDTLIAALKAHDNFQQKSSEKTWLIGILKHKIIDHFRKNSREQSRDDEISDYDNRLFDESGHWRDPIQSWGNPEQAIEDQAFLATLENCLEKLPAHHAELFMLSEFRDLDNDVICKLLDISSTNNMWVLLSRVRARLRHCIDRHWFKPSGENTDA